MAEHKPFSHWLKECRRATGVSQAELARQAGCTLSALKKLEGGKRRPSPSLAARLAEALQIPQAQRDAFLLAARCSAPLPQKVTPLPSALVSVASSPLPKAPTPLLGRADDIVAASALLQREHVRLVSLVGPPGVGKTRLVIELAAKFHDAFADDAIFIPLAAIREPALVLTSIAQTLGVGEQANQPLEATLASFLRDKQLLLALDNLEQVAAAAPALAALLACSPQLKLLVTSRVPLHLQGEHVYTVAPLAHAPAVALFVQRAQAARHDFALADANAPAIAAICARLDGLPLAIELAAAWAKILSPEALLRRLDQRLNLLTHGAVDLPPRHQTLRDAIAWSYELLDADAQALFRRMGVFVGGCTLEAARAVTALGAAAWNRIALLDALHSLVAQSLLEQRASTDGEPRFHMLETIRDYALEQMAASGETAALCHAHASYYLQCALADWRRWDEPKRIAWTECMRVEQNNARAALQWCFSNGEATLGMRLTAQLWQFWVRSNAFHEGRQWLDMALANAAGLQHTPEYACVLNGAGIIALRQGDNAAARALCEQSLAVCRELGDTQSIVEMGAIVGYIALNQGDYATALTLAEESLTLGRTLNTSVGVSEALNTLGEVLRSQGNYARAAVVYDEAIALRRTQNSQLALAMSLHNQGHVMLHQRAGSRAASFFTESLRLNSAIDYKRGIAECLAGVAGVYAASQQPTLAIQLFAAATALLEAIGARLDGVDQTDYDRNLAQARAQMREPAFAAGWAEGQAMTLEGALQLAFAVELDVDARKHEQRSNAALPGAARLTVREIEVLGLVTQGLTNAEIAERLVVSPRTVNAHLNAIYRKLEVNGRAAATRVAVEQHLS